MGLSMKAVWLESGEARWAEIDEPEPAAGEVVVEVSAVGVCNTDLELARGYMGFMGVPGHEFVGVVRAPGHALDGRRVVGEINAGCGTCAACLSGWERHCPNRTVLGILGRPGAFAERLYLPAAKLHVLPDSVDDPCGVFVEPLAAAIRIFEQTHIPPGTDVLLIGDGKLAQLIARASAHFGVRLTAIGRHADKLALMAPFASKTALAEEFRPSSRFPFVFEASGNPAGLELARAAVAPRGVIVLKSTYAGAVSIDMSRVVVDEVSIVGSRCGPFAPAVDWLSRGLVDPRPLIAEVLPFSESLRALELAARPGVLKVIVQST